jgi:hypothetical protein
MKGGPEGVDSAPAKIDLNTSPRRRSLRFSAGQLPQSYYFNRNLIFGVVHWGVKE